MGQVKTEFVNESIGSLAHLDGLNLRLCLGACGELKGLELTEHIHVALELELGCLDDVCLRLFDGLGLKSHANLGVLLLNFLTLNLVFHICSDGELVVLSLKLDPLAGFLGDADDAFLVLDLAFTEDIDIGLLVLLTEGSEFLLVKFGSLGSECTARLSGDDGSEDKEVLVLEGAVHLGVEITMGVHGFAHGEFWVIVLGCSVGGFLASPKVAQHSFSLDFVFLFVVLIESNLLCYSMNRRSEIQS